MGLFGYARRPSDLWPAKFYTTNRVENSTSETPRQFDWCCAWQLFISGLHAQCIATLPGKCELPMDAWSCKHALEPSLFQITGFCHLQPLVCRRSRSARRWSQSGYPTNSKQLLLILPPKIGETCRDFRALSSPLSLARVFPSRC